LHVPLRLDVFYQHDDGRRELLERWCLEYAPKTTYSFQHAAAEQVGELDAMALGKLWDHICVALSHEMIGGAARLFETTVDYTKVRYQFGRPIGSFQALKHRCADLLMSLEFAKAATHHAAQCLAAGEGDPFAPSMAKALASDTYMEAGRAAIQLRGGIGFTWEEDTHLWFKRAKSSEVFMGSPHTHRERMMTFLETAS
jgi:alkylation response protein AidB-like acyl-CoA dehydrogenase